MRIDLAGWTRDATQGPAQDFLGLFERAEALGFEGVWFSEFRAAGSAWPYPSPLLLAAALLARTDRLRVGTSVLVLPLHHPLLLAEEIAQVDYQSNGRLDVGVGRGTDPGSLQALQVDPDTTRARFEQACRILRSSLRGDAVGADDGAWQFAPRTLSAITLQKPHPPMYVAGSTPDTLSFALSEALPLLLSLEPSEAFQLQRLEEVARQAGQGTAQLLAHSSLSRYVCIGTSQDDVRAQLQALWPLMQKRRCLNAVRRGTDPAAVPVMAVDEVLRTQFIYGTPQDCVEQILALERCTGVGQLRCVFNANGLWTNSHAMTGMELFAREVLPALRQASPSGCG